mgnify:CR=1 FL=1
MFVNYSMPLKAPTAQKIPHKTQTHKTRRLDNYHWMRLSDKQKESKKKDEQTKDVLSYINKENAYTKSICNGTEKLQKKLFKEIIGRIKKDDERIPYKYNGYWYITKLKKGKEYPIYYRKKGSMKAKPELLLDVNKLAKGHDYFDLRFSGLNISLDNNILVYALDTNGRRNYDLIFINLKTGKILKDRISKTDGNGVWANDNNTLFYIKNDPITLLGDKVFKHRIGTKTTKDQLVYEETDKTFYMGIWKSKSGKFIIIEQGSTLANDYHILNANDPNGVFTNFTKRLKKHKYEIDHVDNHFIIKTEMHSKNRSIMQADEQKTNRKYWTNIIAPRKTVYIQNFEAFTGHLVLTEKKKDKISIRIIDRKTLHSHNIVFDEDAYTTGVSYYNFDPNTSNLRYYYESLTTPTCHFNYNMDKRTRKLLKQEPVLGGYKAVDYKSERIYATSRDGQKIPISLVYNKKVYKSPDKLLLYGYGSYGSTADPTFSSAKLSLLDRGFCYAIAHIRGGKIYDESWYEDGKMLNKMNTFNDFIDAGLYLIKKKYTTPAHLYAFGGSAGGLLMGVVANMSSDMFNGIIAAVPFVDVVNTMLDETIPLTTGEYDEWGNPNKKKYFDYMLSYSPYDNITNQDYTNLFILSGYYDSQVQYWEPLKWIAKLREMRTNQNLLILDMDMDTGHGGSTGRFKPYKEAAKIYAFILMLEGLMS